MISIIPKGCAPTDPSGYRYISVLNVGQKILDKGLARLLEEQMHLSGNYPLANMVAEPVSPP